MNELRYQLDLLKAMNQKLNAREKMYRLVCDTSYSAYLYYSFEKNEVTMLGNHEAFFDFEIQELKEITKLFDLVDDPYIMSLRDILFLEKSGKEDGVAECLLRDKRTWLEFRTHVCLGENKEPVDKIICISDITKFKSQNEELIYMAYYDSLTGLYNRNYFVRLLGELIRRAGEDGVVVSVMIIDIDDFRKINDGLGIIVGDELVQQFGSYLKDFSSDKIIVCHLNSDVYVMAIYDPCGSRSVEHMHKTIQQRTRKPFLLSGGQELTITVSIGVAEYPEAAVSSLELINCAEIVMFKGKAMGKNTIQFFDTPILNEFLHNIEIENKLKEAIFQNNFVMYYQPQYYTGNKKLRGVEALIRWKDSEDHMISPTVFIPIAEKNGTIVPIGNWVVEQSIRQYAKWKVNYGYPMIMSINISSIQYHKEDFVDNLIQILKRNHVRPCEIELEITESVLIEDFHEVSEKLNLLREYGVRISLDDFGTGFSSLSYLKKLPIDTLKIDKSFIDTVLTDSSTRIITESIIHMVKTLGFESVAEGVEEEQQYKYLHAIGCDVVQGYYMSRPKPAEAMEELLMTLADQGAGC